MTRVQKPDVIEAIQSAAQAHGMRTIAAALNKAPSTAYAELNPWGDRTQAKLGLEDAVEIMAMTGDVSGLELIAAHLGFRLVPINSPAVEEETAYPVLGRVMESAGDLAAKLRASLDDGKLDRKERLELFETAAAIVQSLEPFTASLRDEPPTRQQ